MSPLASGQGSDLCAPLPHIDEMGFAVSGRLPHRFEDLLIAAFDPHDRDTGYSRHRAGELPKPSAEINDALSRGESGLCEEPLVEEMVHRREPLLLLGAGSVDVVRRGTCGAPRMI